MASKTSPPDAVSSAGIVYADEKKNEGAGDIKPNLDTDDLSLADAEKGVESTTLGSLFTRRRRAKDTVDLDAIATQPSVFDDPVALEAYRPPPSYENAHRFDPSARWTWREEKVMLMLVMFWGIMLWAFIMFFALDLDRSNISQVSMK